VRLSLVVAAVAEKRGSMLLLEGKRKHMEGKVTKKTQQRQCTTIKHNKQNRKASLKYTKRSE